MADPSSSYPALVQRVLSETLSEYNDRQLLERFIQSGDEMAFAVLLDRHGPMLLGLCRRLLKDAHLAEDVVQATFLVLARKADSIRGRDSLADWLYGVALRLARQVHLAEAARLRHEQRAAKQESETTAIDPGWDELLRVLDEELQRLPERQRSPLLLCYLEGCTQDEAAKQLGWSLSTLRRRLAKGRDLLRARMLRRGAMLGAGLFAGFLAPSALRAALPREWRHTVLKAAKAGGKGVAVSASVLALVEGGMRMATTAKILLWSVAAATVSGLLMGVAWGTAAAMRDEETVPEPPPQQVAWRAEVLAPVPVPQPRSGHDLFDDPLPNGAIARLGTVAFRHGPCLWDYSLTFTPDGKYLVSSGGGWIRRWEVASGKALVNLGEGWRTRGFGGTTLLITADGHFALIGRTTNHPHLPQTWECAEYDLENGKERRSYPVTFQIEDSKGFAPPPMTMLILQAVFLPGGNVVADLKNGEVIFWNMAGGKEGTIVHHFKTPGGSYTTKTLSADGKTLIVGDAKHTIRVFDVATEKELRSFGVADGKGIDGMAVSPNGKWLVTLAKSGDSLLRLWNLEQGTQERTLACPEVPGYRSLLFTPDSRTVVIGATRSNGVVRTWDVTSGKPGRAWTDDPSMGAILAVTPDNKTLAAMNFDGVIRLYDLATGKERYPVAASNSALKAVCFRPDGKTLTTFGSDRSLRDWEATTGRLLDAPRPPLQGSSAKFMADGRFLSMSLGGNKEEKKVRLVDPATGKVLAEQPGLGIVVAPDGKRMATITLEAESAVLHIWDLGTGKEIQTLKLPKQQSETPNWTPQVRAFTPDGQSVIVQGEIVSVWDVSSGKQKSSWNLLQNKLMKDSLDAKVQAPERLPPGQRNKAQSQIMPGNIRAVAVSPDGSKIAFGINWHVPYTSKAAPPNESKKTFGVPDHLRTMTRLLMFETASGKLLHQYDVDDMVTLGNELSASPDLGQLIFSPDNKLLAVAGSFRGVGVAFNVQVWDSESGKMLHRFQGHRGAVNTLAFSSDGKRLASASEDSTVLIWDVSK